MFSLAMRTIGRRELDGVAAEPSARRSSAAGCARRRASSVAAEEVVGVEAAEHDVGVGERGLLAAAAVAGGARIGAGALRPDLQEPAGVDPADRAAAGADRLRAHGRDGDRQAELDLVLRREQRGAVDEQADVAARPAHVEHDAARRVRRARRSSSRRSPAGDARQEDVGRALGCDSPESACRRSTSAATSARRRPAPRTPRRRRRRSARRSASGTRRGSPRCRARTRARSARSRARARPSSVDRRAPRGRRARCRGSGRRRGSTRPPRGRRRRRRRARRRPRAPRRRRAPARPSPSASSRSSMPMQSRRRASGAGLRHAKS